MTDDPLRDARRTDSIRLTCDIIGLALIAGAGFLTMYLVLILGLWGLFGLWLIIAGLCFIAVSWRMQR